MKRFIFLICLAANLLCADYAVKNYSHLIGMPGFSDALLNLHFKLYEGYVKNTNQLLTKLSSIDQASYEYGALKRRLGWEYDGMRLHELYFENLGGKKPLDLSDPLYKDLSAQFGSFEKWKKDFIATGNIRGIGWSVLYYDPIEKKFTNEWIQEHDTGHLVQNIPLLIMDVFEHAYMPQYGLDKAKYIDAFFTNINWDLVSQRYQKKGQ